MMYKMNADEARTLMLETEAEIMRLIIRFEQETGLTVANIDLSHGEPRLGENPRCQRRVEEVVLRPVLL
jgi:hypothetical protein